MPKGVPDKGVPKGAADQGMPGKGAPHQDASGGAFSSHDGPATTPAHGAPGAVRPAAAPAAAPTRPRSPDAGAGARGDPAPPSPASDRPPGPAGGTVPGPGAGPSPATPPVAPRRRRRLAAAVLLLPALALLLGFAAFVRAAIDPTTPPPGETDGIVVLTGGSERVATGFRLLAEGQARRLLISGAHPEAALPEIAAAAGIDPAPFAGRVTVGHAAASTRGNAAEAAAWARAESLQSLRIVTAGYHMPRAMLELRRAMPALRLVEHPVPSGALRGPGALWRPRVWALLAGEYARYLGAWAGLSGAFVPRRESPAT